MKNKLLLPAILFGLVLSLSLWISLAFLRQHTERPTVSSDAEVDAFMHDVTYIQLNKAGALASQVIAKTMTHSVTPDHYLFEQPLVKIVDTNNYTWEIAAKNGKRAAENGNIDVWGNVTVRQLASSKTNKKLSSLAEHLMMQTTTLTFYPKENRATTAAPVVITQLKNVISAVGAKLDLQHNTMELLAKIKGQYN